LTIAEVDCPESSQAYGKNAKQFTSLQVLGKTIIYYSTSSDRYGRIIAKISGNQYKLKTVNNSIGRVLLMV